jgi:hypothetical protein
MFRFDRSTTLLAAMLGVTLTVITGCESIEAAAPPAATDAAVRDAEPPTADAASTADAGLDAALLDASNASDAARDAGEPDCYAQPQTSAQLLNQCTSRGCVPFDNRARLPLIYADGGVPALP